MYAAQSPAGPAAGGGGNEVRTQLLIVGAALLAIVLIVGGGFWYVSGDDKGSDKQPVADGSASPGGDKAPGGGGTEKVPAKTKSKTLVNVPMPDSAEIVQIPGSWLTDTTYAKSDMAKVVGYNLTDGAKKWEIPLGANVCAASRWVSDNKTAILFDEAMPTAEKKYPQCKQVGVIDLNTGKLLWKATAKSQTGGDKPVTLAEVTVTGQTVAAGGLDGGAAWNLADGKPLWSPKTDADRCGDLGYAGGPALAVIRRCGGSAGYTLSAQALDPVTGVQKSSYKLPAGLEFAQIVSTKPLIVAANVNDTAKNATGVSDLFVLDDGGQLKARIPLTSGNYDPDCGATRVEECTHMVVGNGKIYMPTEEHKGASDSGRTNEIVSFDLETGKLTTDRADAGERSTVFPLRMDGSNLIAYKVPPYDGGGQVVSIDGKTMKQTVLMQNPATKESQRAETQYVPDSAEYRYGNGKLFIARNAVHSKSSVATDPYYIFVSFTTG
ncbi:PQQ-binding-like beta-propeller repeat protein [Streptomyces sp. ZAF1911]|uniref:outer membrane protein assembly factor BamB family protein n=1 Tax=Streptomyces sp. ZAF1911 TaxID=2944129 RepID=UPI00237B09DD|nr:PQQ-binding-like beta-propeller repeat protein [Streptomyces sp. ZAF1911]MDD9382573.1 PQQ-binding-like beta-propeller repeat protein [Streptomyces sp. ZAF1911]